jgi:hypothetical protein
MQAIDLVDTRYGDIKMVFLRKAPPTFYAVIEHILTVIEFGNKLVNNSFTSKILNYTRVDYTIDKNVFIIINYELMTESHPANKWLNENIFLGMYTFLQCTLQINVLAINRFGYIEKIFFNEKEEIIFYLYGLYKEVMFKGRYF